MIIYRWAAVVVIAITSTCRIYRCHVHVRWPLVYRGSWAGGIRRETHWTRGAKPPGTVRLSFGRSWSRVGAYSHMSLLPPGVLSGPDQGKAKLDGPVTRGWREGRNLGVSKSCPMWRRFVVLVLILL